MKQDVIVAGAGIVGVCVALHLAARGRSVTLVDRRGPGEETSFGNAGLIERSSVTPMAFPRSLAALVRYGLNRAPDVSYHPSFLPHMAPWLIRYWRNSAPSRLKRAAAAMLPLIERSVAEHDLLAVEAGAGSLLVRRGWLEAFTTTRLRDRTFANAAGLGDHGLSFETLDGAGVRNLEPHLGEAVVGAVHWRDPVTVVDPHALTRAYADLLVRRGGRIAVGDAATLRSEGAGWMVDTEEGAVSARDAVVALGPWSDLVFAPLGYRIPLAVKRGYHMHYGSNGGATLSRSVVHAEGGYVLAAMRAGIRLTTGVEIAPRDAPPSPVQLDRALAMARSLYPLGEPLDPKPWMGGRPATPDMRPVIGKAPRHDGLWFAFGHAHHGLTLGPVTGRLLADLMTGAEPVVDPAPYAATRFG
ncbi:MAG TPA: FAD-dependent oxidoreductase [Methylomirabilota bacterium]|nr:FAD-dependent oxidoreductase [Methylomirabilota bacterium]